MLLGAEQAGDRVDRRGHASSASSARSRITVARRARRLSCLVGSERAGLSQWQSYVVHSKQAARDDSEGRWLTV